MLIPVVEVPEHPEQRGKTFVRAIVRLHSLDFCPDAHADDGLELLLGSSEPVGGVANREGEDPLAWGRVTLGLENGDGVDEMVKRGA